MLALERASVVYHGKAESFASGKNVIFGRVIALWHWFVFQVQNSRSDKVSNISRKGLWGSANVGGKMKQTNPGLKIRVQLVIKLPQTAHG